MHFLRGIILAMPSEVSFWFTRLQYLETLRLSHTAVWFFLRRPEQLSPLTRHRWQAAATVPSSSILVNQWVDWDDWDYLPGNGNLRGPCITKKPMPERTLDHKSCIPHHTPPVGLQRTPTRVSQCSWQRGLWNFRFFWASWVLGSFVFSLQEGGFLIVGDASAVLTFHRGKPVFLWKHTPFSKSMKPRSEADVSGEYHRFQHKLWANWSLAEWPTDSS